VETAAAAPIANEVVTASNDEVAAPSANEVVTAEAATDLAASETVADAPVANEPVAAPSRIEVDNTPVRTPAPVQPSFQQSIAAALEPASPTSYGISPPASFAAQPSSSANAAASYAARTESPVENAAPGLFDTPTSNEAASPAEAAADAAAMTTSDVAGATSEGTQPAENGEPDNATRQA
jgi:hypothetical protein